MELGALRAPRMTTWNVIWEQVRLLEFLIGLQSAWDSPPDDNQGLMPMETGLFARQASKVGNPPLSGDRCGLLRRSLRYKPLQSMRYFPWRASVRWARWLADLLMIFIQSPKAYD